MSFVLNKQLSNDSTGRPMGFYFPTESQVSSANRSFIPSFDCIRPLLSQDFLPVPGYPDFPGTVPTQQPLGMTYRGVMNSSPRMVNLPGVKCTAFHTPSCNFPTLRSGYQFAPAVYQPMKSLPVPMAGHHPLYVHPHVAQNNHNLPLPVHPSTATFQQSFPISHHLASPLQINDNVGYLNAISKTVRGLASSGNLPSSGAAGQPITMVSPGTPRLSPTLSSLLQFPPSTRLSNSPRSIPTQFAAALPIKISNFQCPHCPFSASTDGRLQRHVDQRHRCQAAQPPPLLPCPDTALGAVASSGQAGSRPGQAFVESDSPVASRPRQSEPGQNRSDDDGDDDEVIVTAVTRLEREPADGRRAADADAAVDGSADSPYHQLTDETCIGSSSESSSDGISDIEDDPRSESLLAWLRLNRSSLCPQANSAQQMSVPEPLSPRPDPRLSPLMLDMSMFSDGDSTPGLLPSDSLKGVVLTEHSGDGGGVATSITAVAQPMDADPYGPPAVSAAAATGLGESAEERHVWSPRGSPSPVVPVIIDIPSPPSILVRPIDRSAPAHGEIRSLVRRRPVKHAKRKTGQGQEVGGPECPLANDDDNIFKCFEPPVTKAARRLSGEKMPSHLVTCCSVTQSYSVDSPRSPPKLFKESSLDTDFTLSREGTNSATCGSAELCTMRISRFDNCGEPATDKNSSSDLPSLLPSQCPEPDDSSPFSSPPLLISSVEIGIRNPVHQQRRISERRQGSMSQLTKQNPANEDGNARANSYSPPTLPSMPYPIRGRMKLTSFPTDDPEGKKNVFHASEFDLPLNGYPEPHKLIMVDTNNAEVYVKGRLLRNLTSSSVTRTKKNQAAGQAKRIPAASEGAHFVERSTEISPTPNLDVHEASRRGPPRSRSKVLAKSSRARASCDIGCEDVSQSQSAAAAATQRRRRSPADELTSPTFPRRVDASTGITSSRSRLGEHSSSASSMLLMAAFQLNSNGEVIAAAEPPPRQ